MDDATTDKNGLGLLDAQENEFSEDLARNNAQGDVNFMQNRELSWLTFNQRVLDQGADPSVPLLARLNFISIFWSNLQEFFMVRVGSLTDLSLHRSSPVRRFEDQHDARRTAACHLPPLPRAVPPAMRATYEDASPEACSPNKAFSHLRPADLTDEQRDFLARLHGATTCEPFLSPQIINARHPFPHLENGKIYIIVRLDEDLAVENNDVKEADVKKKKKKKKEKGADGVVLGLIPLPHQCKRVIQVPGKGFEFVLLEHVIEMFAQDIFSMYNIKHVNAICVTRNADLGHHAHGADEQPTKITART